MIIWIRYIIFFLLIVVVIMAAATLQINKFSGGSDNIDPDYSFGNYYEKVDDQANLSIAADKQSYLHKSYIDTVKWAFPRFLPNSYLPPAFKDWDAANRIIEHELLNGGENKHWTNQTLSYMRKNVQGRRLIECVYLPILKKILPQEMSEVGATLTIVDATANIGGNTLQWAIQPKVKRVISYEINPAVGAMLKNNIATYNLGDRIEVRGRRFDYDVPKNAIVSIDPPYESPSNAAGNFNMSIDAMPIYYVVEKVLKAGAAIVFLEAPDKFKYNKKFAQDHGQYVAVYIIPFKKNKIYAVSKNKNMDGGGSGRYLLAAGPDRKKNIYSCKLEPIK